MSHIVFALEMSLLVQVFPPLTVYKKLPFAPTAKAVSEFNVCSLYKSLEVPEL